MRSFNHQVEESQATFLSNIVLVNVIQIVSKSGNFLCLGLCLLNSLVDIIVVLDNFLQRRRGKISFLEIPVENFLLLV